MKHIGWLLWWSIKGDFVVPAKEVYSIALPRDVLPPPFRPRYAFKKATNINIQIKVDDERSKINIGGIPKIRVFTVIIRDKAPVYERVLMRETIIPGAKRMSSVVPIVSMRYDIRKEESHYKVLETHDEWLKEQEIRAIIKQIRETEERLRNSYDTQILRRIVRDLLKRMNAKLLREGVYFIPTKVQLRNFIVLKNYFRKLGKYSCQRCNVVFGVIQVFDVNDPLHLLNRYDLYS